MYNATQHITKQLPNDAFGPPVVWNCSFFGGYGEGETPVPIPNTAVKPLSADGTARVTGWESRSPPIFSAKRPWRVTDSQGRFLVRKDARCCGIAGPKCGIWRRSRRESSEERSRQSAKSFELPMVSGRCPGVDEHGTRHAIPGAKGSEEPGFAGSAGRPTPRSVRVAGCPNLPPFLPGAKGSCRLHRVTAV